MRREREERREWHVNSKNEVTERDGGRRKNGNRRV